MYIYTLAESKVLCFLVADPGLPEIKIQKVLHNTLVEGVRVFYAASKYSCPRGCLLTLLLMTSSST